MKPDLIARPRVLDRIGPAVAAADIVLLTAVAGAGKSTAVAQTLAGRPALTWLHLDRTDADPERLLSYLRAAFERVVPGISGSIPHLVPVEAAGLLASRAAEHDVVLVLDDIHRLGESDAAWQVVEAILEHGRPGMTTLLLGRRPPPTELCLIPISSHTATVPAGELDLDRNEIDLLLDRLRIDRHDPDELLRRTGGWLAAVTREATGAGCEQLLAHVLDELPPDLVDFLDLTALLPEVTVPAAQSLGLTDVGARFAELHRIPLPADRSDGGPSVRHHPVFRDHLRARFEARPDRQTRAIRIRFARSSVRHGDPEQAVTQLLRAGAGDEAVPIAESTVMAVVDRGEFALAHTWLESLGTATQQSDTLTTAELMLAIGEDDLTRAAQILDRLEATGTRDGLATRSERAAAMMIWCYLHQGKPHALAHVLEIAGSTPLLEAVRYASWMITNPATENQPVPPQLRGDPSDALVLIADYTLGRAGFADTETTSEWVRIVSRSGRVAALRAAGRLTEALHEHDQILAQGQPNIALHVYIGPELLIDAGMEERARAAVEEGRTVAEATGSVGYRALNAVAAAKLELRLANDPTGARRILDDTENLLRGREFRLIRGALDTWYGLAFLKQNRNPSAAKRLRRAVRSMQAGHRNLELPIAAVYLAEAEWRLGNETAADESADLALRTSEELGSNHQFLGALRDFPEVASRRIDAMARSESPWHVIGRALLNPEHATTTTPTTAATRIHLSDFGPPALFVNGDAAKPRITKSAELTALLSLAPGTLQPRQQILDALFDDRRTGTAATYLRQACHHLRKVLPDPAVLQIGDSQIRFADNVVLTCDSNRFEALVSEAGRLSGPARMDALTEAIDLTTSGAYLTGCESPWVLERRQRLADLLTTTRFEAATLSFALGRFDDAESYCRVILNEDPYQESTWRLQMKIANALGSDLGVITAYRRCAAALAELGTRPAASTTKLLHHLRR